MEDTGIRASEKDRAILVFADGTPGALTKGTRSCALEIKANDGNVSQQV